VCPPASRRLEILSIECGPAGLYQSEFLISQTHNSLE
jgi:hypothetical protein